MLALTNPIYVKIKNGNLSGMEAGKAGFGRKSLR
jgi:hypothetical protein